MRDQPEGKREKKKKVKGIQQLSTDENRVCRLQRIPTTAKQ